MIRQTAEYEKGNFKIIELDCLYNNTMCAKLKLSFFLEFCYIHFDVIKWSHNIFLEFRKDFKNSVIPIIKNMGYSKITATFNKDTGDGDVVKWSKFIRMLNFPKPEPTYISILEV